MDEVRKADAILGHPHTTNPAVPEGRHEPHHACAKYPADPAQSIQTCESVRNVPGPYHQTTPTPSP